MKIRSVIDLKNAILTGIGKEAIKADVGLEQWQDVSVSYSKDTRTFHILIRMQQTGGQHETPQEQAV